MATGLDAVQLAVDLMNSNRYRKAIRLLKPKYVCEPCIKWNSSYMSLFPVPLPHPPHHRADVCMYYSTGYGSVLFLQAVFCMEKVSPCDYNPSVIKLVN